MHINLVMCSLVGGYYLILTGLILARRRRARVDQ